MKRRYWIRFKGLYTQNLIVSIPVTGIVLFAISFCVFYGKYDLFIFPFYAEVWGVASDWMIFTVTAITAFYIWKTLKAQQDVQSIQQFATLLEYNAYEQAFAPKFETKSNTHPIYRSESNQMRLDFEFLITSTGYTAKALTLVSDYLRIYPDYPRKEIPKDTTILIFISGAIPIGSSTSIFRVSL